MVKKTLIIGGMTCAACSARVEKAIDIMAGVERVSVNLATEKATVIYDPAKTNYADICGTIERAGYKAVGVSADEADSNALRKQKDIKTLWTKFIIAAAFALPLLYIAMAPMLLLPIPDLINPMAGGMMNAAAALRYALVQLALVIPIVVVGYKFYAVGFKALWQLHPNMDSLIAIGTSAAIIYSIYNISLIMGGRHMMAESLYFESAGVIIALILLGKSLETVSKGKTSAAIKALMELAPKTATVVADGREREIPISEMIVGDVVLVKPGGKIPVDGIVLDGHTAVDESMLTGESVPVDKQSGDEVFAASINATGAIHFKATKIGEDTALAQVIKLVEDAQGSKAPIAKLADIVSGYFVPVVCLIALSSGIAWFIGTQDVEFALTVFISVLVIACPCALGLATPTAIMVGTGKGAENGILIKGGEALETAHKIDTVVLDKTGTITEGKPKVTDIIPILGVEADYLLCVAASAEKNSEHPLGQAIVRSAEEKGLSLSAANALEAVPGRGIIADVDGTKALIGNQRFMEERDIILDVLKEDTGSLADSGKTPMYIALDGKIAGVIAVADVAKPGSREAIESLHRMGIGVAMITGDNKQTAQAIAEQVGIDRVLAEVLPQDKSREVKALQTGGRIVAMVGDGINDAPALAQADIGIAIGSGTDVAMESADIVLMHSDLRDVPTAIYLSKRTIRNIKQNLFWAFGYNIVGIPIAAGLLYLFGGPLLNPMFAAAAMSLSSVSVLTNALRLKRFKSVNK